MVRKKMEFSLKYGTASLTSRIADKTANVTILEPGLPTIDLAAPDPVRSALANPIESPRLRDLVSPGQRVAIVTSDITRPCPTADLLPPVLDELARGGIQDHDIAVVFGLGTHRPHTADERVQLAGESVYRRVRCIDSDNTDVEFIGRTSRGTPVTVFRPVLQADVRVCLGAIGYHYFVGYSGGFKALMPGVCSKDTIRKNHRMMTAPGAVAGNHAGNPVREDIDEAGELIGADFILNVILDSAKRVVHAVAGDPLAAHREGCARLDGFRRVLVERPADLVIVSAGGYPKDINLYQAQKALENARIVARKGGVILLVARCAEGLGNATFEAWMQDPGGPDAIITRIQRDFVIGGHKAAAVAMAMKHTDIYLVSELSSGFARSIGFFPFDNLDEAVKSALARAGTGASVIVMPDGSSVLPEIALTIPEMA